MSKITTKLKNASLEDMALATIASLRGAARAHYTAMNVGYAVHQMVTGEGRGSELAPVGIRLGWMTEAYEEVASFLPDNSPFREPLKAYLEAEKQGIQARASDCK